MNGETPFDALWLEYDDAVRHREHTDEFLGQPEGDEDANEEDDDDAAEGGDRAAR